ncbi:MAG: hypothetical protein HQL16_03045 [Candidatus Omnitrophica bacterium]|nr:hypothetical protein [Candidatus Omnitrophota bacterium]
MSSVKNIGIVLTGSITPNISISHMDPVKRRQEYLKAIKYYANFAKVYFLENSTYPLLTDQEFLGLKNCVLRKIPLSAHPERGKGYQEFEMLTHWVKTEVVLPDRFIKITGRYHVLNFKDIFKECLAQPSPCFLIDCLKYKALALTWLFCIETQMYQEKLHDLYLGCNDDAGDWVERILFRRLFKGNIEFSFFRNEPKIARIDGTTGCLIRPPAVRHWVKAFLRCANRVFDKKYIVYR